MRLIQIVAHLGQCWALGADGNVYIETAEGFQKTSVPCPDLGQQIAMSDAGLVLLSERSTWLLPPNGAEWQRLGDRLKFIGHNAEHDGFFGCDREGGVFRLQAGGSPVLQEVARLQRPAPLFVGNSAVYALPSSGALRLAYWENATAPNWELAQEVNS